MIFGFNEYKKEEEEKRRAALSLIFQEDAPSRRLIERGDGVTDLTLRMKDFGLTK